MKTILILSTALALAAPAAAQTGFVAGAGAILSAGPFNQQSAQNKQIDQVEQQIEKLENEIAELQELKENEQAKDDPDRETIERAENMIERRRERLNALRMRLDELRQEQRGQTPPTPPEEPPQPPGHPEWPEDDRPEPPEPEPGRDFQTGEDDLGEQLGIQLGDQPDETRAPVPEQEPDRLTCEEWQERQEWIEEHPNQPLPSGWEDDLPPQEDCPD